MHIEHAFGYRCKPQASTGLRKDRQIRVSRRHGALIYPHGRSTSLTFHTMLPFDFLSEPHVHSGICPTSHVKARCVGGIRPASGHAHDITPDATSAQPGASPDDPTVVHPPCAGLLKVMAKPPRKKNEPLAAEQDCISADCERSVLTRASISYVPPIPSAPRAPGLIRQVPLINAARSRARQAHFPSTDLKKKKKNKRPC